MFFIYKVAQAALAFNNQPYLLQSGCLLQRVVANSKELVTDSNKWLGATCGVNICNQVVWIYIYTRQPRVEYFLIYMGPSKMTYVYNGIRVKWSRIKWYTRSICTLLYINFDGLYIIMNSPYRSLCTKFIIYAIILYGDQIVRRSFFMAPYIYSGVFTGVPKVSRIISFFVRPFFSPPSLP